MRGRPEHGRPKPVSTLPSSEPSSAQSPQRTYTERLAAAKADLVALDKVSGRYANLRTVAFLGAAGLAVAVLMNKLPKPWWWGAGAFGVVYLVLAVLHHQVFLREARARLYVLLN